MTRYPAVIIHNDDPGPALDVVRAAHSDLFVTGCDSYEGLAGAIERTGAEVVFTIRFAAGAFPRAALVENPRIRWVSVGGSGTDHLRPWDPAKVTVTNASGVAADMMAEYALGAALHFTLGLDAFRRAQQAREWRPGRVAPIAGKCALIVGLGETGSAAARRFKAMGLAVLGVRARPTPTPHVDEVHPVSDLPALLPRADIIVVSVPLLDATRGLLGPDAFARMKPGAILIDVSRGGVVDEAALVAALTDGKLLGAALDVFTTEPLSGESPLWGFPNVIITPHCASVYDGWDLKSAAMFADNLRRYRAGEALTKIVDPRRGY